MSAPTGFHLSDVRVFRESVHGDMPWGHPPVRSGAFLSARCELVERVDLSTTASERCFIRGPLSKRDRMLPAAGPNPGQAQPRDAITLARVGPGQRAIRQKVHRQELADKIETLGKITEAAANGYESVDADLAAALRAHDPQDN